MEVRHLNQRLLAIRWNLSERTLEKWRWQKTGPAYVKVGEHVIYRIVDVEEYEREHRYLVELSNKTGT